MGSLVLTDNGYGTLAAGIIPADTSISLATGHGARFPAVDAGQCLYLCILNANNVLEEVICTAHTAGADSFTVTRAANGTTAKAWQAGDRVEARASSEVFERLMQEALPEVDITTSDSGQTYVGSLTPAAIGYVTGKLYPLALTVTNTGAAPTINLNGLGAKTVKANDGAALAAGQMPTRGIYLYDGTNLRLSAVADGKQLQGSTSTHAASSGNVGEYLSVTVGPSVGLPHATGVQVASLAIPPGDWDVSGAVGFAGTSTSVLMYLIASISTATGDVDQTQNRSAMTALRADALNVLTFHNYAIPPSRYIVTSTATLRAFAYFGIVSGTASGGATIQARRRR